LIRSREKREKGQGKIGKREKEVKGKG